MQSNFFAADAQKFISEPSFCSAQLFEQGMLTFQPLESKKAITKIVQFED